MEFNIKSNGHIECDQCRSDIVNGHVNNIRAGYNTDVKVYQGMGMLKPQNLCVKHRVEHYQFPQGTVFSGAY